MGSPLAPGGEGKSAALVLLQSALGQTKSALRQTQSALRQIHTARRRTLTENAPIKDDACADPRCGFTRHDRAARDRPKPFSEVVAESKCSSATHTAEYSRSSLMWSDSNANPRSLAFSSNSLKWSSDRPLRTSNSIPSGGCQNR